MTVIAGDADKVQHSPRTVAVADIIAQRFSVQAPRILVVGCGSGREAAILAQRLQATVVGIDIEEQFDPEAARLARLQHGDATSMDFPDAAFDLVYSYHALEHIPDYHRALEEMHRVLRAGGTYCIGTPNRGRLIGYVGGESSFRQKVEWNLNDWHARLAGRFRNELGAHAGYTAAELREILLQHFGTCNDVTGEYYERLYSRRTGVVRALSAAGMGRILFPSVYFIGTR
jgi:ubiquinone/menaquinone biosynthesis C-methylase UbiE